MGGVGFFDSTGVGGRRGWTRTSVCTMARRIPTLFVRDGGPFPSRWRTQERYQLPIASGINPGPTYSKHRKYHTSGGKCVCSDLRDYSAACNTEDRRKPPKCPRRE